jgi:hypothetical protein
MIVFLPTLACLFIAGINLVLFRVKSWNKYQGGINIFLSISLFLVVLAFWNRLPASARMTAWEIPGLSVNIPAYFLDEISWVLAAAISLLLVFYLLTERKEHSAFSLKPSLFGFLLCGAGFMVVFSENVLGFVIGWAYLDTMLFLYEILFVRQGTNPSSKITRLGLRLGSILILLVMASLSEEFGLGVNLSQLSEAQFILVLLAVGLRLVSVFSLFQPELLEFPAYELTFLTGIQIIAGNILLARITSEINPILENVILLLVFLLGSLGILDWLAAKRNEIFGVWWMSMIGLISLAYATGMHPEVVISWSLAASIGGIAMYWVNVLPTNRRLIILLLAVLLSGIPFSPLWAATRFYSGANLLTLLFMLPHIGLMAGPMARWKFIPLSDQRGEPLLKFFNVIRIVVLFGLYGWISLLLTTQRGWEGNLWSGWILIISAGILVFLVLPRIPEISFRWQTPLHVIITFSWFHALIRQVYLLLRQPVRIISDLLEGESGTLWALLFLVIFISLVYTISV